LDRKSPKEYLRWVFHRHVPNPEFQMAQVFEAGVAAQPIASAALLLVSDDEPDWDEVTAMAAAILQFNDCSDEFKLVAASNTGREHGRKGVETRQAKADAWKKRVANIIDELRHTAPQLFDNSKDNSKDVKRRVMNWASEQERRGVPLGVADGTVANYIREYLK
jgi:hypothetical protein